jgi:putative hemolysin
MMPVDELQMILDLDEMLKGADDYDTVGGLFMSQLSRIPWVSDKFEWKNLCFEMVDMDGHRVNKVLIMTLKPFTE